MTRKIVLWVWFAFMGSWTGYIFISPYFISISSLDMNTVKGWSESHKDDKKIMRMIKDAASDDFISRNEYRNILYVIVDKNEAEYTKKRETTLNTLKTNVGLE